MSNTKKNIVFITGATSGFGRACAEKFAANGYPVIISGRRKEILEKMSAELAAKYAVEILALPFDIQHKASVFSAVNDLPKSWQKVQLLINNAGLAAGKDFFDQANIEDWDTMINTNVKGLVYMTKALLPLLIANGNGHIINIGSTAAKEVYEKGNLYCATKHAVDAISTAMRIDLLRHGMKVTAIHPGAAETEFSLVRFKGNMAEAKKVYQGYKPLQASDVADVVYYCSTLPPHVCINDLVMTCTAQANAFYLHKGVGANG